jgi:anti-sigma factor RsiW
MSDTDALLVAYVDGELDPETALEIEKLVAADPRMQQTLDIYRETAGLLRSACSEHVYATDAERLMPAAPCVLRRAPRRYGLALGAALAACAVGFLAGSRWSGWSPSPAAELVTEVAEYHAVFAREEKHLVEIPADRVAELTGWLGKRLEKRLTVPDLSAEGLNFVGGRMLVVNGRPVAQMMYTRAQGRPVAFCITKLEGPAAPVQQSVHDAQRTALWQDGSYAYVLVGEVEEIAMQAIAAEAARQSQG